MYYWNRYRYLVMRRVVQISIITLYFGANAWGWNILMGNFSSSILLSTIPLSDPYAVLQMLFAGAVLATDLVVGAIIIALFYTLIGGRVFCSWVCPMNIITDLAAYIRRKLEIERVEMRQPASRAMRYWILALSLIISSLMGVAAFEFISPISMLHRGIIFGFGFGFAAMLIIFLFDIFVLKNGWCGHLCPLGGFYALLGRFSLIRVRHTEEKCSLCMRCTAVCPEHQVLHMVGKKSSQVLSGECTNCARCIEVCDDDALGFSLRKLADNKNTGE